VIERVIALVLYLAYFAYGLPAVTGLVCGVFAVVRGWCFMLLVGLLNKPHSFFEGGWRDRTQYISYRHAGRILFTTCLNENPILFLKIKRYKFSKVSLKKGTVMSEFNLCPTVTVYRDNTHVRDLVQLGFAPGLLTESILTNTTAAKANNDKTTNIGGNAGLRGNLPSLASVETRVNLGRNQTTNLEDSHQNITESHYAHTEASAVQHIVQTLRSRKELTTIEKIKDARDVRVGDFVEFEATFRPNEVSTLLDIFTPETAGRLAKIVSRRIYLNKFKNGAKLPPFDERQQHTDHQRSEEEWVSELTEVIVQGLQADLRSNTTREYYGLISGTRSPLTAVVACESSAFITADPDRLLDGEFKVFGKVISKARHDVSIFDRSKILARIQAGALGPISDQLEKISEHEAKGMAGEETTIGELIDFSLPAQIKGWSFGVLPVAIYI